MKYKDESEIGCRLQKEQLKILAELDRVCKMINATYIMAFGSALGAIRHRGFIPWDDDIDVYMRVDDLEKLQENANLFDSRFFLQHHDSDPEYGLMITRLRNSNTTLIEEKECDQDINHGIFIDIYPLFNTPIDGIVAQKLLSASMIYRLFLYGRAPRNRGIVMKIGADMLLKAIPKKLQEALINRMYNVMKSCRHTGYLTSLYGDEQSIRYDEKILLPVKWMLFEDIQVPIEADADAYLTMTYGDYMKLPPIEKRVFHHDYIVIDFEKSYKEYRGIEYCKGR